MARSVTPTTGSGSFSLGAAADFSQGISALGGAYVQSQALRAQASYQQKISEINYKMSQWQANDAVARGGVAANQQINKANEIVGEERAAQGGSGVDVNSGSALRVQNRTQDMGALDALTLANNATREAFGYKVNAINQSAQGQFAYSAGNAAATNTMISGGLSSLAYGLRGGDRMYSGPKSDPDLQSWSTPASSNYTLPDFGAQSAPSGNYTLLGGD